MSNATKIETVIITEKAEALGSILYAGEYLVEMPADYDASEIAGEDILCDGALTVVEDEQRYGSLDELYMAMTQGHVEDWQDLPVFGGEEPANTLDVWSWDAKRLIVGQNSHDIEIVRRPPTQAAPKRWAVMLDGERDALFASRREAREHAQHLRNHPSVRDRSRFGNGGHVSVVDCSA
jgi:hypothetical protein